MILHPSAKLCPRPCVWACARATVPDRMENKAIHAAATTFTNSCYQTKNFSVNHWWGPPGAVSALLECENADGTGFVKILLVSLTNSPLASISNILTRKFTIWKSNRLIQQLSDDAANIFLNSHTLFYVTSWANAVIFPQLAGKHQHRKKSINILGTEDANKKCCHCLQRFRLVYRYLTQAPKTRAKIVWSFVWAHHMTSFSNSKRGDKWPQCPPPCGRTCMTTNSDNWFSNKI